MMPTTRFLFPLIFFFLLLLLPSSFQSLPNKIIHGIMIPLQLWGVLHLVSFFLRALALSSIWFLLAVAPVFLLCDWVIGGSFVVFLFVLTLVEPRTHVLWGPAVFVAANLFQTKIGHSLEERGRDDTALNLAEFKRTRNPIPLMLIFFYHWAEIWFLAGYRKDLAAEVARAREATKRQF
jgi:hypothetical protein